MEKRDFINANNEKIDIAKQLKDMFDCKGWEIVKERINDCKKKFLLSSKDDLFDNYNEYKALRNFVNSLEDMINDAEKAIEDNDNLK